MRLKILKAFIHYLTEQGKLGEEVFPWKLTIKEPEKLPRAMDPDDVILLEVIRAPDLFIELEDVEFPVGPVMTNEEYPVNFTIFNNGTLGVQGLEIDIEFNGTSYGPIIIPEEILPGGHSDLSWTLNTTGIVGDQEMIISLDPVQKIFELDEDNNSISSIFEVLPRPPGNINITVFDNDTGLPIENATAQMFRGLSLIEEGQTNEKSNGGVKRIHIDI